MPKEPRLTKALALAPTPSTLLSVSETLADPVSYVRRVLEKLWLCENDMGDAQVVIGHDAAADMPHYRIQTLMNRRTGYCMEWQTFNGATHRPLAKKTAERTQWSTVSTPLAEVANLIGELRGFEARPAPEVDWA